MRETFAIACVVLTAAGLLVAVPAPRAEAACHIAAFTESAYSAPEGDGEVVVTIYLQGRQPTCGGSVAYETLDGTATAPADYTARQGTICFTPNGAREESVTIPIADDEADEPDETFSVRLSDAESGGCQPDNISGSSSTTVTIVDDDAAAPAPTPRPATPEATETAAPATTAPATATPEPTPTPVETATRGPSPTPTSDASDAVAAGSTEDDGGSAAPFVVALIVALVAVGAGAGLWYRSRRTA